MATSRVRARGSISHYHQQHTINNTYISTTVYLQLLFSSKDPQILHLRSAPKRCVPGITSRHGKPPPPAENRKPVDHMPLTKPLAAIVDVVAATKFIGTCGAIDPIEITHIDLNSHPTTPGGDNQSAPAFRPAKLFWPPCCGLPSGLGTDYTNFTTQNLESPEFSQILKKGGLPNDFRIENINIEYTMFA